MILLLIGISSFFTILGQISFKLGMQRFSDARFTMNIGDMLPLLAKMVLNPFVIFGFISFGLGAILWLVVLAKEELSYAVPAAAMSYILVVFLGALIFKEPITVGKLAGVVLIGIGIYTLK